jgi:hypothetical protein
MTPYEKEMQNMHLIKEWLEVNPSSPTGLTWKKQSNRGRAKVEVEEVRSNVLRWPAHACVYHAEQYDRDIKVEECFPPQ